MNIHESAENYLESILIQQEDRGYARSIDIANMLNFSKPSVSVAMKNFRENGYIVMDSDGHIKLTAKGKKIAVKTYNRHKLLRDLLLHIGVSEENATEDACKIEHDISDETYNKLMELYSKMNEN